MRKSIGKLYEMMSNRAGEVYNFFKIRGEPTMILDYMQSTWMASVCTVWNLHMATTVKSIALLMDKGEVIDGATIAIVNKGGWASFLEMMGDVMCATNRLHHLTQRNVVLRKTSRPSDPEGKEDSSQKAKTLQVGSLLARNGQKLSAERSVMNQSESCATARQITSNAEKKSIVREWKTGGSTSYNGREAERVVALAAETVGGETGRRQRKQRTQGHTIRIQ